MVTSLSERPRARGVGGARQASGASGAYGVGGERVGAVGPSEGKSFQQTLRQ